MDRRIQLHNELVQLLANDVATLKDGQPAIIFQPPESIKLKYPCVLYNLEDRNYRHANNHVYIQHPQYELIVIDTNPDSQIAMKIVEHFEQCRPGRRYTIDNLYHDSITLYY